MLQTHGVTESLSFLNFFLLSQWYNFSCLPFITSLVTVYWQVTIRCKEKLQALECLFPSAQKSGGHSRRPGGIEPQATNAHARGRLWKKGKAHSFPGVRDGILVFLKCKLITKREGDNNKQNSKKTLDMLEGSRLIPGYISHYMIFLWCSHSDSCPSQEQWNYSRSMCETKFKYPNLWRDILTKSCTWGGGCCWEWGQVKYLKPISNL